MRLLGQEDREVCDATASRILGDGGAFYLVSNGAVLDGLNTRPLGFKAHDIDILAARDRDPSGAPSVENPDVRGLMQVYRRLNAVAFGTAGMPLEAWVMTDLGLLPSAFLLVTLPLRKVIEEAENAGDDNDRSRMPASVRRAQLAQVIEEVVRLGYRGLVPVAGYCAAPTPQAGRWVGWSLCSLVPGCGTLAKALALDAYGTKTLVGVTQYDNVGLRIHVKFGTMRMLAAVFDTLHTRPQTLVYETTCGERDSNHTRIDRHIDPNDLAEHEAVQHAIDRNARVYIVAPGRTERGNVPVCIEDTSAV